MADFDMDDEFVQVLGVSKANQKNVAAAPAKGKKAAAAAAPAAPKGGNGRTIEETYQKLTQLEHILLRPDTYIGSTEMQTQPMWVCDPDGTFSYRMITYAPGLYKIFDEILVNAADNKQRDPSMDTIKISIDQENNKISVWNNGRGIPVAMHEKENVYVPELIFGQLLTSSNYDDNEKKTTGGRNGYGAKLCNIFSKEFTIETCDGERRYVQTFTNNMSNKTQPKITAHTKEYTSITFRPDLGRFGMTSLDGDIVGLLRRRAYDIAGTSPGVKVFLNDVRLPLRGFKDYIDLYLKDKETGLNKAVIHEKVNDRWEVAMVVSDGQFSQVSFVNSIATTKGGTHVDYVTTQLTTKILEVVAKKNKAATVKPHQVKSHMTVFINALIENPTFDSQTKENMTLRAKAFGSECPLSDKFVKQAVNSGIVEQILNWAKQKQQTELASKCSGSKKSHITGIAKLDDANEAGGRNSDKCTLILTEGDSAKALAVSGLAVVGRDYYGVFPLRGKPLNVREATHKQIMENQEIQNVVQILGLQFGKTYETTKGLRYGHLMLMTDQDHDGSHIKGLLINFFHHFWPSLLRVPGFLVEFITPIVKAMKGNREQVFFTLPEYESWKESIAGDRSWKIKYYKGLGTSTSKEAKEYFSNMGLHQIDFRYQNEEDDASIDMAFSKKKADERKEWLQQFRPGTYLDHKSGPIAYADFINKELILFSMADNVRSIPSVVDGFKPSQRKVLFSCFKRNLKDEIKVAQLAGYVAEHSAYHHGEQSLAAAIINMAQNYVGSNNINLLVPSGQFGTRLQGGKDAASPRYVFTRLSALTRLLFNPADDALLNYLDEDGQRIEPEWYAPILPLVLINGSDGIGTGWSSFVPNYCPRAVAANIKRLMDGMPLEEMTPFYKGFGGSISRIGEGKFLVEGIINKIDDTTLEITELPIGTWTQAYKEFLESMMTATEKAPAFITDYREYHTDTTVRFVVTLPEENMRAAEATGLAKKFKLEATINTSNMMLFDDKGRIRKYDTVEDILGAFFELRMEYYQRRKESLSAKLEEEWRRFDNKVRFIQMVIRGELVISNRKKQDILADLKAKGFAAMSPASAKAAADAAEEDVDAAPDAKAYDYLLSMPLWSLTMEKVQQLLGERAKKEDELKTLLATSTSDLWRADIDAFLAELDNVEQAEAAEEAASAKVQSKGAKGGKKPAVRKPARKAAMDSDDDIEEFDEDEDDDFIVGKAKKRPAEKKPKVAPAPVVAKPAAVALPKAAPAVVAAPKPAAVAAPKTAPAKKVVSDDDDDDPVGGMSLADRLAARMMNGATKPVGSQQIAALLGQPKTSAMQEAPAAKQAPAKAAVKKNARAAVDPVSPSVAPTAKRQKACLDEEINAISQTLSDVEIVDVVPKKAAAKAKPAPVPKKAAAPKVDMFEFSEDDNDAPKKKAKKAAPKKAAPAAAPAPVPVPAKAPAAAKKAAAKPKAKAVSDDDDGDDNVDMDAEYAPVARPRRATVPKKYVLSDSEEEEEDNDGGSDFEGGSDDDFSDA